MRDQAENLRKAIVKLDEIRAYRSGVGPLHGRYGGPARVITITSGKGGVGKTSVSVNLALALCDMNHKPLIIDADVGLANVEVLFGILPKYNLMDALIHEKPIREIICEGPKGVKLISGGSEADVFEKIAESHAAPLMSELAEIDGEFDVIIIDTGAGVSETVLGMAVAADDAVIVTTPEPTAVTDAYALIKAIVLRDRNTTVRLIINKAENEREAAEIMSKLTRVTGKFLDLNLQKLGYILNDPLVVRSVKQQQPFMLSSPQSQTSKTIREIARRLMEGASFAPIVKSRGLSGFLSGVVKFARMQPK